MIRHLSPLRSRPPLWLVAVPLGFAAAGCGGASAHSAPAGSPTSTVAPPSASALRAVRSAAALTGALRASVVLDFAGLSSAAIPGQGSFSFAAATGRALIRQPVGTETAVFQPTIVFDHPPPADAVGLPQGKTWIAAEPSERIANATSFDQFVMQIEGKNPVFLLDEVSWGATSAAPLGSLVIGGVSSTGYLVGIDLASAASSATGPAAGAFASTFLDEERALGPNAGSSRVTLDVWVDPEGRIVRIQGSPPGSGVGTTTMTVTAFGARVDPARPPKADTVDLGSLAPGGDYDRD